MNGTLTSYSKSLLIYRQVLSLNPAWAGLDTYGWQRQNSKCRRSRGHRGVHVLADNGSEVRLAWSRATRTLTSTAVKSVRTTIGWPMATPSSCHVESSIRRFENSPPPESQHLSGLVLDPIEFICDFHGQQTNILG